MIEVNESGEIDLLAMVEEIISLYCSSGMILNIVKCPAMVFGELPEEAQSQTHLPYCASLKRK